MILEADRNGCAREVLIIAAALSIQDPRERPADAQQAADDKHRRFADPDSDFIAYLDLWDYLAERQRELSSSAFRRLCRAEYLNYLRVREWQDLQGQLQRLAGDLGVTVNSSSAERTLRACLPASRLAFPGRHEDGARQPAAPAPGAAQGPGPAAGRDGRRPRAEYLGARNARFADLPRLRPGQEGRRTGSWRPSWWRPPGCGRGPWPASSPEWVEPLARHLVKRSYSEPHWERKRGAAVATGEGHPVRHPDRGRPQGRYWPRSTRRWPGSCSSGTPWSRATGRPGTSSSREHRADRARRASSSSAPAAAAWWSARTSCSSSTTPAIPADVVSARHFDTWWKQARRADPGPADAHARRPAVRRGCHVGADAYPDVWTSQSASGSAAAAAVATRSSRAPSRRRDHGHPAQHAQPGDPAEFSWQVPGLRPSWSPR